MTRALAVLLSALLLAPVVMLLRADGLPRYYALADANREQARENEFLRLRNAAIAHEIAALKTDAGIEERAREELGMIRDGEVFYRVAEPRAAQ